MLAENMLKVVSILTLDDIEELKSLGAGEDAEEVVDKLRWLIEDLRMSGRGVDRPVYSKALLKLNELQTALGVD